MLKLLASVFVIIYVALFGSFVAPLVSSEYGDWAGLIAAMLFAFFAIGCGYFGRRFERARRDEELHQADWDREES